VDNGQRWEYLFTQMSGNRIAGARLFGIEGVISTLVLVLPAASTSYSNTIAMVLRLASLAEEVV
jgi:hypothetical protein